MKHRYLIVALFLVIIEMAVGQSPVQVPSRMTFADIRLKITQKGRETIQEEVDRIMQSPKYYEAKVAKANTHFPIIEQAFKEEGVSSDFKYLSLQESALIPDAVSSSNAVGYWQFKDFTAIEMGLRVDKHIDERMNIYSSSRAAARYMKMNNTYFDNWLYALQAYQMGAGDAMKVVDKKMYGSKSMTITDKTYWYVRTFLAHKIAYESVVGKTKPNPELIIYNSGKGKHLMEVAKENNIDYKLISSYNKWLLKGKIPDDKEYPVILIANEILPLNKLDSKKEGNRKIERKIADFDALQNSRFPEIDNSKKYANNNWMKINGVPGMVAKANESISGMSEKGGIEISKFLKINDITIDHWIKEGQLFYFNKKHKKAKAYYHVVQENENLWSVSQKYGIRLTKLLEKNRLKIVEDIVPGRVLWLRHIRPENVPIEYKEVKKHDVIAVMHLTTTKKEETSVSKSTNAKLFDSIQYNLTVKDESLENDIKSDSLLNTSSVEKFSIIRHQVKVGETLYRISKLYDVEVMDIVRWNGLSLTEDIDVGQIIIVHTTKSLIAESLSHYGNKEKTLGLNEIKYVVKTGDTMYKISRQYGVPLNDILGWNKKNDHDVSIGEVLIIKVDKKVE